MSTMKAISHVKDVSHEPQSWANYQLELVRYNHWVYNDYAADVEKLKVSYGRLNRKLLRAKENSKRFREIWNTMLEINDERCELNKVADSKLSILMHSEEKAVQYLIEEGLTERQARLTVELIKY